MQIISTKSRIYLNNKNKSPSIFLFTDLELERNALCVAFQKDPEKGYHWNDSSRHLYAYSRHEVTCETCFRVKSQSIGVDSLFINSVLRSIYYQKYYCIRILY